MIIRTPAAVASNGRRRLLNGGVLCLLMAMLPLSSAVAGQFSVTPVRLYMTPQDRAIAVTVTNEGDQPLVMQADLYLWKQKPGGADELTLTEDIFLSPPIIKLAPRARQVVRLARLKSVMPTEQLTYRMIVREVPEAAPAKDDLQVQLALAFSIPVFITPPRAKAQLVCGGVERVADNTIKTVCENSGNAHAYPIAFSLVADNGQEVANRDSGAYLLPGIKRDFEIKRAEGNIPGGKARLSVTLVDGSKQSFDVTIPDMRPAAQ